MFSAFGLRQIISRTFEVGEFMSEISRMFKYQFIVLAAAACDELTGDVARSSVRLLPSDARGGDGEGDVNQVSFANTLQMLAEGFHPQLHKNHAVLCDAGFSFSPTAAPTVLLLQCCYLCHKTLANALFFWPVCLLPSSTLHPLLTQIQHTLARTDTL